MGISRSKPQSNTTRSETINKAKAKKDSVLLPADNILSANTSSRLDDAVDAYTKGEAAIITAEAAEAKAMADAIPQRKLLNDMIGHFFSAVNHNISFGTIPRADRAFYGLDVNNNKTPLHNTDAKLTKMATTIISGDKARTDGGGVVITLPTILAFTAVYTTALPFIQAISKTKEGLSIAKSNLRNLNANTNDVIEHVWDEAESHYSSLEASAKRAICRLWSVRYKGIGILSDVLGKCTDSVSGLDIAKVEISITGSAKKVLSNITGDFDDPTTMYGDLELVGMHPLYVTKEIAFVKENGVNSTVNVVMIKK